MLRSTFCNTAAILAPRLKGFLSQPRCNQFTGDDQKTTARVLNQEIGAGLMIDGYSQAGFRLNNGMSVIGPMAIFPKSVLSWRVRDEKDITEDSLSLFYLLEPKLDILIIGVGDRGITLQPRVLQYIRNKGLNIEVLPTESACSTFNFLNDEKRCVAAALIPPANIRTHEDELLQDQLRKKSLFIATIEDEIV
ncbi:NADH dehydrogenase [ubiquinone] 1 alpha subcomplex assembly factor 3-like [Macrobrachium nipponense]|uniref:NADH dehydrogenase [ubiquinone] 1 alpha subcomplex assembly factor 3-like n=1 Tax=Macrobrachium nipponense TaxID=159736 RepID=UPI0030C8D247